MTYTTYAPKPKPDSDDYDDERQYRADVEAFERARSRIFDAVDRLTEVVQDNDARFKIRAAVPFRVTAYRHDFDDHRVDKLRDEFGKTPPGSPTDGFVDAPDDFYRSIPFTHNQEWAIGFGTDDHESAKELARDALQRVVFEQTLDGRVSVPITVTVLEERRVDDGTSVDFYECGGRPPDDADGFDFVTETVERDFDVGRATYAVDGVVEPGEWEGGDE